MKNTSGLTVLALMTALALAGCAGDDSDAAAGTGEAETAATPEGHGAMEGASTALNYQCAEGEAFTLVLLDGASRARLEFEDETHDLEAAPSDEGMGYVGDDIAFMGQGTTATVTVSGEMVYSGCEATGHGAQ